MSDNRLLLFSQDPKWRPTQEAADRALQKLKSIAPYNEEISAEFYDHIEFHHGFGNWSGAACPRCTQEIEDWFFQTAALSYEQSRFADLTAITPCCQSAVSLNDLNFGWPAGFSLFALEAMNPQFGPTPQQIVEIEAILGTKCRVMWEHI